MLKRENMLGLVLSSDIAKYIEEGKSITETYNIVFNVTTDKPSPIEDIADKDVCSDKTDTLNEPFPEKFTEDLAPVDEYTDIITQESWDTMSHTKPSANL